MKLILSIMIVATLLVAGALFWLRDRLITHDTNELSQVGICLRNEERGVTFMHEREGILRVIAIDKIPGEAPYTLGQEMAYPVDRNPDRLIPIPCPAP